mmetsp:Transcript_11439/g.32208  ORF Transcript_11439/g.32208 Transcript_11439/m.32208 type:complete len:284 (-) Transcript_11439:87-938(-)
MTLRQTMRSQRVSSGTRSPMFSEVMELPWISSLSNAPASAGICVSLLPGAVNNVRSGETKSGKASRRFASKQTSLSRGNDPMASGSERRKLPLRKRCWSCRNAATSSGSSLRLLEMSTSVRAPRKCPISGGRAWSAAQAEMRISTMPSNAKAAAGGTGKWGGGQGGHFPVIAAKARRCSSKQIRNAGFRLLSCGLCSTTLSKSCRNAESMDLAHGPALAADGCQLWLLPASRFWRTHSKWQSWGTPPPSNGTRMCGQYRSPKRPWQRGQHGQVSSSMILPDAT